MLNNPDKFDEMKRNQTIVDIHNLVDVPEGQGSFAGTNTDEGSLLSLPQNRSKRFITMKMEQKAKKKQSTAKLNRILTQATLRQQTMITQGSFLQ